MAFHFYGKFLLSLPDATGRICVGLFFPVCHCVEIPKSSVGGIITARDGIALGFHALPVLLCLLVLVHYSVSGVNVFVNSSF